MDETMKKEIDAIVAKGRITREDIEMDLDTRENYPGEFYVLALMHISTDGLRKWLEATA